MFISFFFAVISASPLPLQDLRHKLQSKTQLSARFEQQIIQEIFPDSPEKASGRIEFTRPKKFRWIYELPEKKELNFDGSQLKLIREGKTEKIPASSKIGIEESFSFLWGDAQSKHFEFVSIDRNSFWVIPKNPEEAQFKKIRVQIKNDLVQKVIVTDLLDGESRLIFSEWKLK